MLNTIFVLKLLLLVSFSFCYLNFGHDGGGFIFQAEYYSFTDIDTLKALYLDPFFCALCLGQILIFISLFAKSNTWLMITGILIMGIIEIVAMILGIVTGNMEAIASTIPFFIIAVLLFSKTHVVR